MRCIFRVEYMQGEDMSVAGDFPGVARKFIGEVFRGVEEGEDRRRKDSGS
jgi:hypothetical protein